MVHFSHGPHARVCAIATRRKNAPRWTQAGHVDGENGDECRVNLEHAGPHGGACVKLHVLHAACSVRGTRGVGSRDDTLVRACMRNNAGSVPGDVSGDLAARVTGEWRALARMADPSKASACCDAQGDDKAPSII